MKKQPLRRTAQKTEYKPQISVGKVLEELTVWSFGHDKHEVRHIIEQMSKAIQMNFHLNNFGTRSFGISEEGEGEE
jgi:hypothetical protein